MAAFLRTHRRRAGLTLEGLAEQTGLTKSYLSKVERGISTPSIAVALKIARVLDADVGQLFSDSMEGNAMTIVRAKDRVIDPASSVQSSVYDPIAPSMVGKAMQPFVVHPASVMGPKFMDHTGEEFVFVHSGSVEFEIPGQTMHLDAGDSCISTRIRHTGCDRCRQIVRWCWLSSTTSLRLDHPAVTHWKRTAG